MARQRPKDEAGNDIDPGKDLEKFLQAAASSEEPTTPQEPAWKSAVFEVDDPELKGKTGEQVLTVLAEKRQAMEAATARTKQLEDELSNARRQQEIETTTRRILAESQPKPQEPPPAPDPRYAKRQELWTLGDYETWASLNDEIQRDERRRDIETATERAREQAKSEVFSKLSADEAQARSRWAYTTAVESLRSAGVPDSHINDVNRITSLYSTITRKPTPGAPNAYYDAGGPMNPNVIAQAYRDLFGVPAPVVAATAVAPTAAPQAQQQPKVMPPPGSNKPTQAAAASRGTASRLNSQEQKEVEQLANAFAMDPEKLAARRRARMERDAHA